MHGDCMICTGMYGNGVWMGTEIIRHHQQRIQLDRLTFNVSHVVVAISTMLTIAARRIDFTIIPAKAVIIFLAFALHWLRSYMIANRQNRLLSRSRL